MRQVDACVDVDGSAYSEGNLKVICLSIRTLSVLPLAFTDASLFFVGSLNGGPKSNTLSKTTSICSRIAAEKDTVLTLLATARSGGVGRQYTSACYT